MDVKNIFVVVAPDYTKEEVVDIIKQEGYLDNFVFGTNFTIETREEWQRIMLDCDEVWVFGKTNRTLKEPKWQHSFALANDLDLWIMG